MYRAGDIAAALRGSTLEGHPVEEGLGGTFLVQDVDPSRVLEAWQAAHAAISVTGRWPVFTLPGDLHHEPEPAELVELDRAARTLDPWSVYRRHGADEARDRQDVERYVEAFLGAEMVELALQRLPLPTTSHALQRWVYDTVLADPHLVAQAFSGYGHLVGTSRWHTWPEVQLVLLPTTAQWLAPAWVSYFGAARDNGYPAWAAAMRLWDQRWNAGLVAAWGTMLQFTAPRQPEPGPQAWDLAGQLMAVGGSLQCEQWQLAIVLARGDAWFLHDRP